MTSQLSRAVEFGFGAAQFGRMVSAYNDYFRSGVYAHRYPVANRRSLAYILGRLPEGTRRILDFGCGNGRYALALLEHTDAHIVGFDVSGEALAQFEAQLADHPQRHRITLVHGKLEDLAGQEPFDAIISMFGVLSHIPQRRARRHTLTQLAGLLTPRGRVVISVPNITRRRVKENLGQGLRRLVLGDPSGGHEPGDIVYKRALDGRTVDLYYHLYTKQRLNEDLAQAGLGRIEMCSESVLNEAAVTRTPWLGAIDARLSRLLPSFFGYGLLACAEPNRRD